MSWKAMAITMLRRAVCANPSSLPLPAHSFSLSALSESIAHQIISAGRISPHMLLALLSNLYLTPSQQIHSNSELSDDAGYPL